MRSDTKRLARNTILLYILVFSSQILNVITIPYQTRVLGPSVYGIVGFIVGLMGLVTIILDFGFLLSATKEVSENRDDVRILNKVLTSVSCVKLILLITVFFAIIPVGCLTEDSRRHMGLLLLYCSAYAVNAFLPDYVYRGLEDMKIVTLRTVGVRVFFTVLVFVFLKGPETVFVLPLLLLIGNMVAVAFSYLDLWRRYGVRFVRVGFVDIRDAMKDSAPFFFSRSAASAYQTLNVVILGAVLPGQVSVGFYSAAEKFLGLTRSASSPIADSLYPYMVRNKDYRLCVRILLASAPVLLILGIVLFLFADPICAFAFGEEYRGAGVLLRCLLPAILVIFPTYIVCFPILVPMGLSQQANRSSVLGAIIQLALLAALFASDAFSAVSLCIAASISEVAVFAYRLGTMLKHRERMKRL